VLRSDPVNTKKVSPSSLREYRHHDHGDHGNGGGGGSGTMGRGPGTGLGPGPGPGTTTGKHAERTNKNASISNNISRPFFMKNLLSENKPSDKKYYTRFAKSLHLAGNVMQGDSL
jgi:hypothetical protein